MHDKTIYTIGHSTRDLDEFLSLLHSYDIELLVDVRSLPGSNKFPHYNKENLEVSLPQAHIEYLHLPKLGGRRKVQKNSLNTRWNNPSFRAYADYMETAEFQEGVDHLIDLAQSKTTAFMCSEILWWRCHRSMIADYLKAHSWTVLHILKEDTLQEHPYTQPAQVQGNVLSYHDTS